LVHAGIASQETRLIAAIGSARAAGHRRRGTAASPPSTRQSTEREPSPWVKIAAGRHHLRDCILTTQIDVGAPQHPELACTIGHDVTIGGWSPCHGVHVWGRVAIEDEVFIGTGA